MAAERFIPLHQLRRRAKKSSSAASVQYLPRA
jgi:hypothetical protein